MHITEIIKKPILTEKSYKFLSQNVYTFEVNVKSNKIQIKNAFETIFEVKVDKVNVINYSAKEKRVGKYVGKKSKYKKAIIKLRPGEKLELFDID